MGKLLPARINSAPARPTTTLAAVPDAAPPQGKLPRSFYALARNAVAMTEGELAVIVPATEEAEGEGAYFTAAVTWGLEAVGCSIKMRPYLDILIEMAAEDTEERQVTDWFSAADLAIGRRARLEPVPPLAPTNATIESVALYKSALAEWVLNYSPTCPETGRVQPSTQKDGTVRAWAARERKKLIAWQQAANVTLVQVEEGDFDQKARKNRTTRYRLLLLEKVGEVLRLAKGSDLWNVNPLEAIRHAAHQLFRDLPHAPALKRRKATRKPDAAERLKRRRRAIITLMRGCREDIREMARRQLAEVPVEREWLSSVLEEAENIFAEDFHRLSVDVPTLDMGGPTNLYPPPGEPDEDDFDERIAIMIEGGGLAPEEADWLARTSELVEYAPGKCF